MKLRDLPFHFLALGISILMLAACVQVVPREENQAESPLFAAETSMPSERSIVTLPLIMNLPTPTIVPTMDSPLVAEVPVPTLPSTAVPTPTATPDLSCADSGASFRSDIWRVYEEWYDTVELAVRTPRLQVSTPIAQLQQLRRDADDIRPPTCMEPMHDLVLDGMSSIIESLLDFSAGIDGVLITNKVNVAKRQINFAMHALNKIQDFAGVPDYYTAAELLDLFSQWEFRDLRTTIGEAAYMTSIADDVYIRLHLSADETTVNMITISALQVDTDELPQTWDLITPIIRMLLGDWEQLDQWLAGVFSDDPTGLSGARYNAAIDLRVIDILHKRYTALKPTTDSVEITITLPLH